MKYYLMNPKEEAVWCVGECWGNRNAKEWLTIAGAKRAADRLKRGGNTVHIWCLLDDGTRIAWEEWRLLGLSNSRFTQLLRVK